MPICQNLNFFLSLEGDNNQLMSEVWDCNINGTKLKKTRGWFLNTANGDGDGSEDDDDGDQDGGDDGGEDGGDDGGEDGYDGGDGVNVGEDGEDGGDDRGEDGDDGGEDDASFASEDCCEDEIRSVVRAVQLLAINANFPISAINALDWNQYTNIYST